MPSRTSRIELRAEPRREERIRYAAELSHQSVSAFVLDAASDRAEQVIAASSATVVPTEFFDAVWDALDQAPQPNRALARRATATRKVTQR